MHVLGATGILWGSYPEHLITKFGQPDYRSGTNSVVEKGYYDINFVAPAPHRFYRQ